MIKRALFAIGIWLLLASIVPAGAQAANWTAWLYNNETGRMVQVDEHGDVRRDLTLPTVIGHTGYSHDAAVSHRGTRIAYTVHNPDMNVTQLLVFDTDTNTLTASYSPGRLLADSIGFGAGGRMFNEFDTALAYGFSLNDGSWRITVLDVQTGRVLFTMASTDPLARLSDLPREFGWTPVIQHYEGVSVIFSLVLTGTEGQPTNPSYEWNVLTNVITPNVTYPVFVSDTFAPTGEVIMAIMDERLPNQLDTLPLPIQFNALHVYTPITGGRYPFFNNPAFSLNLPRFIQNGQRVMVRAYDLGGERNLWPVLERNGTLVGFAPITQTVDNLLGVGDGYLMSYFAEGVVPGGEATALVHAQTDSALEAGRVVWTGALDERMRLVWVDDTRFARAVEQIFLPWAQLAEPVAAFESLPVSPEEVPTVTPLAGGFLAVGRQATVNTTEGDSLNIRSGPGTGFDVVARLSAGARVTLLEGPRDAGGFTWWRIRISTGLEGWAVQSVDDGGLPLQTLVPS